MQICTYNVNSIRVRLPRLLPWLEAGRPDVVCLQELKCLDGQFPRAELEARGYQVETFGQKTYNGVAILARTPLTDVWRGLPGDPAEGERRVIGARVGGFHVVNVYVVNGQDVGTPKYAFKLEWMARLRDRLAEVVRAGEPVVVVGDFNVTFDDRDVYDPEEWREQILCSTPEREALRRITALGLIDSFRRFHEEGGHYTWWDFRTFGFQRKQGLRIDHVLASDAAMSRCRDVAIDLDMRRGEKPSDHAPVTATFD